MRLSKRDKAIAAVIGAQLAGKNIVWAEMRGGRDRDYACMYIDEYYDDFIYVLFNQRLSKAERKHPQMAWTVSYEQAIEQINFHFKGKR